MLQAAQAECNGEIQKEIEGPLGEILKQAEETLAASAEEPTALYRRGLVNYAAGNSDEALDDLTKASKLVPKEIKAHVLFVLGNLYRQRGDHNKAFRMYTQALRNRDSKLLSSLMKEIAAQPDNDSLINIKKVIAHLPYHGDFTAERIMGAEPWLDVPAASGALSFGDEEAVTTIKRRAPWEDDVDI